MYIHGGGWMSGSKSDDKPLFLTAHGYAVASIDYRFSQEAHFPAQIHDCKAAVRWIRAHARFYNIDSAHIGVWGPSAGGHLAALLGTSGDVKELEGDEGNLDQTSRVQAVCDWYGPTDFLKIAEQSAQSGLARRGPPADASDSLFSKLIGGAIQMNKEKVALANPLTFISKDDPPFLIMHGDKDSIIPLAQSEILRDALRKAGVEVQLVVLPGAHHSELDFRTPEIFQRVLDFFDAHLKMPAPAARK
jgi:acetyl esterase/lipase